MQLAFCVYKYFPYGGLQRDLLRIALECQRRGHKIRVYTFAWQGDVPGGFDLVKVPKKGLSSPSRNRHYYNWVQQHMASNPVDKVIGFNKMPSLDIYYAADGCYAARVNELHGRFYRMGERYKHFAAYERAVFDKNSKTKVLMISETQRPIFRNYYQTRDENIIMLPPGISPDRRAPENADELRKGLRAEFAIGNEDYLLLMVGSGFKTKGVDRSLLACSSLPDSQRQRVKLFVIGEDNSRPFHRQSKKLGISQNVQFLKGRGDIPRFMQGADLLIHPAYYENTGTVILEAIVAGLPVLASAICGFSHYIQDACCGVVLSQPFKQEELNQQLYSILTSANRSQWRQNGIEYSKSADIYSMPQHAANHIEAV